jgi:cytochrome c-type biogenesis protein CcmH/NrfF
MTCGTFRLLKVSTWVLVLVASLVSGLANAQLSQEELDRHANQIYQQVFSPFCPGRSLNDCPSSKAHDLKEEMRQKLEQGVPAEVVLEQVFQQYGDQYRAVPQYAGFGRLVWWAPVLFLALGSIVALVIARGKRSDGASGANARPAEPVEAQSQSVSPELRARIEAELARFD